MIRSIPKLVVVHETCGNWAGLLRHQLIDDNNTVTVLRVETLDSLTAQLGTDRRVCLAVQIARRSAVEHLDWLHGASRGYPDICFCGILADDGVDAWTVYEAGASLVIRHPLEIPNLARVVRRYFRARSPAANSAGSAFTIESLWLNLPWCEHATAALDTWTNRED